MFLKRLRVGELVERTVLDVRHSEFSAPIRNRRSGLAYLVGHCRHSCFCVCVRAPSVSLLVVLSAFLVVLSALLCDGGGSDLEQALFFHTVRSKSCLARARRPLGVRNHCSGILAGRFLFSSRNQCSSRIDFVFDSVRKHGTGPAFSHIALDVIARACSAAS